MRENLIKENHSEVLVGHFGRDKKIALVAKNYLQQGMKKFV